VKYLINYTTTIKKSVGLPYFCWGVTVFLLGCDRIFVGVWPYFCCDITLETLVVKGFKEAENK